jgi:hypothetical protein
VSLPGPGVGLWLAELIVFAVASAVIGGAVRTVVRHGVPSWRTLGPIERLVLDLYLGGAVVYAVAILPLGLFTAYTFPAVLVLAVAGIAIRYGRLGGNAPLPGAIRQIRRYLTPGPAIALGAAAALGLFELVIAVAAPTGNTYDASQLATYTSLLITQHSIPITLSRAGLDLPVVYPQGVTVWMGTVQLLFGLPPARTAVLVTPLFLGLVPLGAYTVGSRWFGTDQAGAVLAVAFAVLASWTRFEVTGSYDFVASFPLLLLLLALSKDWVDGVPSGREALVFGLLAGYVAALSPVGAEWWLVALPVAAGLSPALRRAGVARRWIGRYALALVGAVVPVLPELAVVAAGAGHIGFSTNQPGVGTLAPVGLGGPQVVGYMDPFLFGANATWLSPFPILRAELALLLVAGLALLVFRPGRLPRFPDLPVLAVAGGVAAAAWFAIEALARAGVAGARSLAPLTNGQELAQLLSTVFALVAAVPLVSAFEVAASTPASNGTTSFRGRLERPGVVPALAVGLLLLVPGLAVTATQAPPSLAETYRSFGNVSADDFALLAWAPQGLPSGARILVDPGSAAAFLPAYDPAVTVLYPMVLGFEYPNTTYRDVVRALTNGTLNESGFADLLGLGTQYVAITQSNSVLGAPFSPAPLLAQPGNFRVVFHEGDAYVFSVSKETALGVAR